VIEQNDGSLSMRQLSYEDGKVQVHALRGSDGKLTGIEDTATRSGKLFGRK
jgi:hypothetical protein